jgi:hypothetical protein
MPVNPISRLAYHPSLSKVNKRVALQQKLKLLLRLMNTALEEVSIV